MTVTTAALVTETLSVVSCKSSYDHLCMHGTLRDSYRVNLNLALVYKVSEKSNT